ncbi:MAG TPA: asparagine synthase C-terminal domain-containing protein [Methanomicrobiales archaeon]|nr:asparagine synthase C-terminal domain-containing protein [Methanomicrobiales archaeon]
MTGSPRIRLQGWVELGGRKLTLPEVEALVGADPGRVAGFGGEFYLTWDGCTASDRLGILGIPGPFGIVTCGGNAVGEVNPDSPTLGLEEALRTAVRLRADQGVVSLSGGVDSSLIACLAGLPCVTVGMEGSRDLEKGGAAAQALGLSWEGVTITEDELEAALPRVTGAIPGPAPLDVAIATGFFFVARWAAGRGYRRILVGQGADELFAGYARYRTAADIPGMLARDFASLRGQALRDQAVARLHGTSFSLPYLDLRVVRAAQALPPGELLRGGTGKIPLRELAARLLTPDFARAPKKAMQYGSGIAGAIRGLAGKNGYKRSVREYLIQLLGEGHDLT